MVDCGGWRRRFPLCGEVDVTSGSGGLPRLGKSADSAIPTVSWPSPPAFVPFCYGATKIFVQISEV
jgi:hypothetical protein